MPFYRSRPDRATPGNTPRNTSRNSPLASLSRPAILRGMWAWMRSLLGLEQPKTTLAERGENMAARFLRNHGYKILQRNFRTPVGEIDIVARLGQVLVFVEVKTRMYDDPAPEEQVNQAKQHQITKAAKVYLSRFGVPPAARFDVVAVVWPQGRDPIIRHTPSAFEATF